MGYRIHTSQKFSCSTTSRLELKFQAHSQSPPFVDWNIFLVESSLDDLRYETRNSFRGETDALNEHFIYLCVHRRVDGRDIQTRLSSFAELSPRVVRVGGH
ncbi:hypothetical protein IQ244_10970 [Nostoc sp. LEGE 06077]|uniref:hypothetical protein n=1 Tax=Nostoc sp. LEGE 06077 TaxID=915325 RepID=UPI00187E8FC5|nr:hypothetical protein [Nostoc sp. LEGE 06077]MBE9207033.1 hypothetical protein [Nostoc sp. LEGE 06077]